MLAQIKDITEGQGDLKPNVDMFEQGMDRYVLFWSTTTLESYLFSFSLSTTFLRLRLAGALKRSHHPSASRITETTIYLYPTVNALAAYVSGSTSDKEESVTMESLIEKYSVGLTQPIRTASSASRRTSSWSSLLSRWSRTSVPSVPPLPTKKTVLITGTTGNLGAEMLSRLLVDDGVERVFALNRICSSTTSMKRHEQQFLDHGLDPSLLGSRKLVYLEGDSSQPLLGLNSDDYELVSICLPAPRFLPLNNTV